MPIHSIFCKGDRDTIFTNINAIYLISFKELSGFIITEAVNVKVTIITCIGRNCS